MSVFLVRFYYSFNNNDLSIYSKFCMYIVRFQNIQWKF